MIPYTTDIINRIHEDERFGRVFFLRCVVNHIMGLRISPLGVVASTSETRVIDDLILASAPSMSGVIDGTNFATAPPCQLGHAMREDFVRILYLRRKYGVRARTVLSKMDAKYTFGLVPVEWAPSPTLGYIFRYKVVTDRRLQFESRNSPGIWGLFASALEYSHVHTLYDDAVIPESGRDATAHIKVTRPEAIEQPAL